jgi:ribosomal protein S18 acetylase RimI-like enzyme
MKFVQIKKTDPLSPIKNVITSAFSQTPDSNINDWFSLEQMFKTIKNNTGIGLKSINAQGEITGIIHAMQENPINGREGTEKWVITNLAVTPNQTGKGIGTRLISELEEKLKNKQVKKIFVHTNLEDSRVIHFYERNGYKKAGQIKNYYYDGSAVFLLKEL